MKAARSGDLKKDAVKMLEAQPMGTHGAPSVEQSNILNPLHMHEPGIEPGRPLRVSGF